MAAGYSVLETLNKNSQAAADSTPSARIRTKDLSIHDMRPNENNFYHQDDIESLAAEILLYGLKKNLEVKYSPEEGGTNYEILDGERRWRALHLLVERGHKEFEFASTSIKNPQNEREERIGMIVANSYRTKTIQEEIEEERHLKADLTEMKKKKESLNGYDLENEDVRPLIAAIMKKSETKIAQMEKLDKGLIPEFREEFNGERLTFSAAYELSGMNEEEQRKLLGIYEDTGELSYTEVKERKDQLKAEKEAAQIPGQMEVSEDGEITEATNKNTDTQQEENNEETAENQALSDSDNTEEKCYLEPDPDKVTSICYSCKHWNECDQKTNTATACNEYINKAESEKTEEQRYSEEQDRIDKETAAKLREQADEEKMNHLPSDNPDSQGITVHQIRCAAMFFEDKLKGIKAFELRKNDRNYKVGDIIEEMEFKDGRNTGRAIREEIIYMLEDYTGLEEGYCILGTRILKDEYEQLRDIGNEVMEALKESMKDAAIREEIKKMLEEAEAGKDTQEETVCKE